MAKRKDGVRTKDEARLEVYRKVTEIRDLIETFKLEEEFDETYGSVVSIERNIPRSIMDKIFEHAPLLGQRAAEPETQGGMCAKCKGTLSYGELQHDGSRQVTQAVSCNACGRKWTEVYELVEVEDTEE